MVTAHPFNLDLNTVFPNHWFYKCLVEAIHTVHSASISETSSHRLELSMFHPDSRHPQSFHKSRLRAQAASVANITYLSAIRKTMHSLQVAHNNNICILVPP
jgi:hypothetical protein